VFPAARAVAQTAEHARRGQTAHLGERRDADAELYGITPIAPVGLFRPELVVAEQRQRPVRGGLVVAGVVGQPADRGVRELLVGDPVAAP
jgi:hypothetical protein